MFDTFRTYVTRFQALPGLEGPLIGWGVVAIAFIVMWATLFEPYIDWREHKIQLIESQSSKLVRLNGLMEASDRWKQAHDDFQQKIEGLSDLYFQGSSYAAAQTSLLKYVRKDMTLHHLVLESQRLLDAELIPGVGEKIAIHIRLHGKLSDVLAFVDALSRSARLLTMDSLYVAKLREGEALLQLELSGYRMLADEESR